MELNNFIYFSVIIFAVSASNYCIIREPIRKVSTYNFTTLTNLKDPKRDINVRFNHGDSGSIRLQLCQQLKEKCDGKDGYSVCLERDKKEIGIGKYPANVDVKDGRILFVFKGDNCKNNINYTVNIIMKCDYEVVGDSKPESIHETFEECTLYLLWRTIAACGNRTTQNCTLTDKTGLHYDLSSLTRHSENYLIPLGNNAASKIILNVCHSVIFEYNALCQMTNGACLKDSTKKGYESLGDVRKPLYLDNNSNVKLEYEDGAICKTNKNVAHIKTTITFTCDFNAVETIPEYIGGGEQCNYQLLWRTAAACSTESLKNRTATIANKSTMNCATEDDAVNLGSLAKSASNYVIKANKTEFYINVCRPLVSDPHTNLKCMFDGSGACKVSSSTSGNVPVTNETSLGFPKERPIINDNHETVLRYTDGSACPENPKRLISSNITFPCDSNDEDSPEFKKYEDCTYVFEWKTRLTCGAVIGKWVLPCIIKDQSHECDLSSLQKVFHVNSKQRKGYNISICNSNKKSTSKGCDSAICDDNDNNYGSVANVIFDYGRDEIKIQYTDGGECADKSSYTSEVRLICREAMGIGTPQLLWESECTAEFEWYTNVTCSCRRSAGNSYPNPQENASPIISSSSHAGTIAGIILTIVALISAFIYFRNPDKRACFKSCYNLFNSRRDSGRVQYCRVNTTEEARLLLDIDPTQCQTDSDDDLLNA